MKTLDDSDINRILRNMEKKFSRLELIKSIKNPRLKHHLFDKYMYAFYEREPKIASVQRGETQYQRAVGVTRSHVSYKQYIELNKGLKENYQEEYQRLKREGKIRD